MTDQAAPERERFQAAIAAFDATNADDPNSEDTEKGPQPRELLYGQRMSAWLERLYPDASEPLRLAVRCQHIERWRRPRRDYPEGRVGYLTWRRDAKSFHAERAAEILAGLGYPQATIARVASLVKKERLKADPEAQALEDVVCLVFLAHVFEGFAAQHDDAKVVDIIQKTWRKMSDHGRQAALGLTLSARPARLIETALAP
jgi:hypothetical protein